MKFVPQMCAARRVTGTSGVPVTFLRASVLRNVEKEITLPEARNFWEGSRHYTHGKA
jgi:hypothetical protein